MMMSRSSLSPFILHFRRFYRQIPSHSPLTHTKTNSTPKVIMGGHHDLGSAGSSAHGHYHPRRVDRKGGCLAPTALECGKKCHTLAPSSTTVQPTGGNILLEARWETRSDLGRRCSAANPTTPRPSPPSSLPRRHERQSSGRRLERGVESVRRAVGRGEESHDTVA